MTINERLGWPSLNKFSKIVSKIVLKIISKIHELIHEDLWTSSLDIVDTFGSNYDSVQAILTEYVNMDRISADDEQTSAKNPGYCECWQ